MKLNSHFPTPFLIEYIILLFFVIINLITTTSNISKLSITSPSYHRCLLGGKLIYGQQATAFNNMLTFLIIAYFIC